MRVSGSIYALFTRAFFLAREGGGGGGQADRYICMSATQSTTGTKGEQEGLARPETIGVCLGRGWRLRPFSVSAASTPHSCGRLGRKKWCATCIHTYMHSPQPRRNPSKLTSSSPPCCLVLSPLTTDTMHVYMYAVHFYFYFRIYAMFIHVFHAARFFTLFCARPPH